MDRGAAIPDEEMIALQAETAQRSGVRTPERHFQSLKDGVLIMNHTHASSQYQWAGGASFVAWRATIFQPPVPFTHTCRIFM